MAIYSKLAVILHADVVGSTALVHKDERVAHERIQDSFRRFSAIIAGYGGITHELRVTLWWKNFLVHQMAYLPPWCFNSPIRTRTKICQRIFDFGGSEAMKRFADALREGGLPE